MPPWIASSRLWSVVAVTVTCTGCGLLLDLEGRDDDGTTDAAAGRDGDARTDARSDRDASIDASALDARPSDGMTADGFPPEDGMAVDGADPRPSNDRCETATDLVEGTTDGLTLCGATATLVAICSASGTTAADVFFRVPPESAGAGAWLVQVGGGYLIQEIDPETCVPTGMCAESFIHAASGSIVMVERTDGADDCGATFSIFVSPM